MKNVNPAQADIDGNFNGDCRGKEKLGGILMCVVYIIGGRILEVCSVLKTLLTFLL